MCVSFLFISLLSTSLALPAETPPNVVFIISDDHGWSDYSFMNHPRVRTPNIDRLRGLAGNTLVVYITDNGWVQLEGQRPLLESRAKQSPFDAGTRTPVMVRWPGKVKPRRDDRTLVSSIDIAPTVFAACGVRSEHLLPGLNLLDPGALARRESVFGATFLHTLVDIHNPVANLKYRWVIRGRWKLIDVYRPNLTLPFMGNALPVGWPEAPVLYDILADPREQKDLAARQPEIVRSLKQELNRWWPVPAP